MPIIKKKDFIEADAINKSLIEIRKNIDLTTQSIVKLQQATRETNKEGTGAEAKKRIDLTKQLEAQSRKLIQAEGEEAKQLALLKVATHQANKENTEAAKINLKLSGEYQKQSKQLNELRKQYKDLAVAEKGSTKEAKALLSQITKLDAKLKRVDTTVGQSQRKVGQYGDALKGLGRNLLGSLGVIGGFTALFSVLKSGVKIFKDFEKSSSKLAAILGKSKDEIKGLTEQAKLLGSTTAFTASEVISLQTELAKLGFTTTQIEASTAGILALAAATGSDLASSAELAGSTLRIFNLDASEMGRVTDVLAKSTTISSLSMEKLATIMPTVGKTAQLAGVSLERTAALAGTLTDRGLDASSAATSLRNIFLELSNKGITWQQAMEKINNSTDKNKASMDLFGKRAAAAGAILAETATDTDILTTSLEKSAGAAQKMADVMLDNLSGDITKAQSAWEGFVLSLEDGNGIISKAFRGVIQTGTGLLTMLTVLNTEYANSATKAQEMNKAAADTIPLWEFQMSTLEALIPVLKKLRIESERIANLRGENVKGLKERNTNLKTFLFTTEMLTDSQAAETKELIKSLKHKRKLGELNKVENSLLTKAILKLQEYTYFQNISTEADKDGSKEKDAYNKTLEKQAKELEKLRKAQGEYEEIQRKEEEGRLARNKETGTDVSPIGTAEDLNTPFDSFNDYIKKREKVLTEATIKELELETLKQEGLKEIRDTFLSESIQFGKDITTTAEQERLDNVLSGIEAEKEILQQQLDDKLISEQEFTQKTAALDKKARQESAKSQKRQALYTIGIDTAVGIVKALASSPPPANFVNAGIVAAMGAIRAAFVAAKPLPAFKDGVIGFNGKGTGTSDSNTVKISNKESVITALGTANAPVTLDAINRGLLTDTEVIKNNHTTKPQNNNILVGLLEKANSQNNTIIRTLSNLGYSYSFNGQIIEKKGNGEIINHLTK